MALAKELTKMEAQSIGVSDVPSLEAAAVGKLREKVLKQGGLHVSLDCRNKILAISEVELDETILPLCSWLIGLVEAQGKAAGGRVLVGMVGAAAAGKSTLAQLVCAACDVLLGIDKWGQCVSMDGYSFSNSHLLAQPATDHLGNECTLKDIKGAPSTLDAKAFLRDLLCLRSSSRGAETILLPAYSRVLHDPVPECVAVVPECRVVIVEGLHLLHVEDQWKKISNMFHRTVFLDIERSCCFERVVGRKVANGRSRESSEAHFWRVDGPIFDQLQEEKKRAHVVLTVRPNGHQALLISNVEARLTPITTKENAETKASLSPLPLAES